MRRAPKDGRYPPFPDSDEDSEYTPSPTEVLIIKGIAYLVCAVIILTLIGLIVFMANGIVSLGRL